MVDPSRDLEDDHDLLGNCGVRARAHAHPKRFVAHVSDCRSQRLRADALSIVFLVPTTFLYTTTPIFTGGYLHLPEGDAGRRYASRFYTGLNIFCWSMAVAPLVNGLALLWVAIEVTTVVSALLVAIDDTDGATEAAWKYVLLASLGLGHRTAWRRSSCTTPGPRVFGSSYDLSYGKLLSGAHAFPTDVVRLADVLAVLGFGTKMGLVPVHTWLPDAHSEAPTPVSALLSGALLATSFYAILRYFQMRVRSLGPTFPRNVLLIFGLASLVLAALYLLSQRDLKRLLAYSSVEHMGILAIGMSFGAPSRSWACCCTSSRTLQRRARHSSERDRWCESSDKGHDRIRGGVRDSSVERTDARARRTRPLRDAALRHLPERVPHRLGRPIGSAGRRRGGARRTRYSGLLRAVVVHDPDDAHAVPAREGLRLGRGETSRLIVVAMVAGLVGLVILGIHVPGQLSDLLHRAATQLKAAR